MTGSWTLASTHVGRAALWTTLVCMVVDRTQVLLRFGFLHTSSDDVVFWAVANDMAHGLFREPFLYGQNYNPALESLLAVPLLRAAVPVYLAMPLVTSLLTLLPFVSFACWHFTRKEYPQAVLFAAMPVLLPVEWSMLTTVTRGFVTGLAPLALLPWTGLIRGPLPRSAAIGAILYLAFFINPNALPFVACYFLWHVLHDARPWRTMWAAALAAAPLLLIHFFSVLFYVLRPAHIVHRLDDWRLTFHPTELIPEALVRLDMHFAWTTPLWWKAGSLSLLMIAVTALALGIHRGWRSCVALLATYLVFLVALAFPKVHDGFHHVVYAYARNFLATPLVLAWGLSLLPWNGRAGVYCTCLLAISAPAYMVVKLACTPGVVAEQMNSQQMLPVREFVVADLFRDVNELAERARSEEASLIIGLSGHEHHYHMAICYGASSLSRPFPPTLFVGRDRRTWRREAEVALVHRTILVLGGDEAQWDRMIEAGVEMDALSLNGRTIHSIRNNTRPVGALIDLLGMPQDLLSGPAHWP